LSRKRADAAEGEEWSGTNGSQGWATARSRPSVADYDRTRANGPAFQPSAIDRTLLAVFGVFAFTSIFMEPYITLRYDRKLWIMERVTPAAYPPA